MAPSSPRTATPRAGLRTQDRPFSTTDERRLAVTELPAKSLIAAIALCIVSSARSAHAFTIQSSITEGCHENITAEVLRRVRRSQPQLAAPLATTKDDRALMQD